MRDDVSEVNSGGCMANLREQFRSVLSQLTERFADDLELALEDRLQV
jgi:hypothetical protein